MKNFKINSYISIIAIVVLLLLFQTGMATKYSGGLEIGYANGFSFQVNTGVSDFATGFPLKIQFATGYTKLGNPGSAPDARKIFINNATNGIPEKSGRFWDFQFNFLYRVKWLSLQRMYVFGGPRYEMFTANFKYIGGNEDFDVTTNQWGIGTGVKSYFSISPKFDMVLTAGVDYYFSTTLKGHDTSYDPDGEDINSRETYTYSDADNAINQPKILIRLMIGINYSF